MASQFVAEDTKSVSEKGGLDIDPSGTPNDPESAVSTLSSWSAAADRKLLRKIDFTLMPWLTLLFLLASLDRVSIGNAKTYGLEKHLHMTDNQYLWALTVFYFPYAAFEVPYNLLLKKLSPRIWLSITMCIWGVVVVSQGLVHNAGGLTAVRFCLGVIEAGVYPGVNYYLSCWYRRSELGFRGALFWSAASGAVAFGGLLAAAISNMDGIGGKATWSWLFLLLGMATVVVGFASFWMVQNFPAEAKFLTEDERAMVIQRMQRDSQYSAGGEEFSKQHIWAAVKDWKTWLGMFCVAGGTCAVSTLALFLPTIVVELGYRATQANLMAAACACVGSISAVTVGYLSDRLGRRGWWNVGCGIVGITGYIILLTAHNPKVKYLGTYIAGIGVCPLMPNSVAWMSNNFEGTYKRSVCLAMICGFANLNGAVASNIYRAKDAPNYHMGHSIALAYVAMTVITSLVFMFLLDRENKARDAGLRDELILSEHSSEKDVDTRSYTGGTYETIDDAKRDKGDAWSGYRYML
ncbi:MFS general substrate transporter [Clavulina sp. PMI_390]|nr:MFS general substrate transporter [Clavulina sp. PMI_390]